MIIKSTPLAGLFEIHLDFRADDRGYFMRTYDREIFQEHGLQTEWVQENQSLSRIAGTIRGLHFQKPPHAETKLVRALSGRLLDVAVDLRAGSSTYGQHYSIELSAENHRCLYIPKGFAHGFCTMAPDTIIAYKVDHVYSPAAEGGLRWNAPQLGIAWPLQGEPALISLKDSQWLDLEQIEPLRLQSEGVCSSYV
jgi:dTDP-4-dehydrorhamnose 3,5-epimerase